MAPAPPTESDPKAIVVERFYLGCLAHASYLIASGGSAAVIDPQRDVQIYLDAAKRLGVTIRHVIETHLHADFVSGHRELAQRTGARIYLGQGSGAKFPHVAAADGNKLEFGRCRLEFLQTPGHTLESVCVLMTDLGDPSAPQTLFTGDTLFVGDVGRPDLSPVYSPHELAAMLYQSLHTKILPLPDETIVYPAHGAGSLCGRQMGPESFTTLGKERRFNYALQARNCDEFVSLVADNLPSRPEYFAQDVELNRSGAPALDSLPPLAAPAEEVRRLASEGAVLLDTRSPAEFAAGHVPGSLHIGLSGQFASWAGRLMGLDSRVVLIADDMEGISEAQMRLARVGIDKVLGYLADGTAGWVAAGYELEYIPQVSVAEFEQLRATEPDRVAVIDVRERSEHASAAIPGSTNIPLGELASHVPEIDPSKLTVVHCKGGYRSSAATSILRRAGVVDIANLAGGYDAWALRPRG